MTHPSKTKGNNFEREVVETVRALGLKAERSWSSDGRSRGLSKDVDVTIEGYYVQCKRRHRLPAWTKTKGCDMAVFREDNGETMALMPFTRFLVLLNGFHSLSEEKKKYLWGSSQKT